ncbi:MAG: prevent-host-death protein [Candidatus Chryseobacterium colombiense]|nr:prevent-host-death protein [Chryseobacterium sp.]WEK71110.1 MAG: prevent-host-death protein [Chryseobacterium sp.]
MDTNRFKASHDFSNIQKNLSNNRRYRSEGHFQQADMKNQNQESSKNGFVTHAPKTVKEVWAEIQEMNFKARYRDDKK